MRASETREERKKRARVGVGGLIEIKLALPACSFGVNREMLSRWEGKGKEEKKKKKKKKNGPYLDADEVPRDISSIEQIYPLNYTRAFLLFLFSSVPPRVSFSSHFPEISHIRSVKCKIIRARNRFLESKVDLKISRPRTNFRSLKFFPSLASSRRRERKILYSVVKRRQARFTRQNFFSRLVFARALLPYLFRIHRSKANPQDRRLRGYCSSSISLSRGWSLSISVHRSILPFLVPRFFTARFFFVLCRPISTR